MIHTIVYHLMLLLIVDFIFYFLPPIDYTISFLFMKINDITKYKKAKLLTKDLEKLIVILKQYKKELTPYRKYHGVSEMLINIVDSQVYFQVHLDEQRSILNSKGEIDEN